jgi:large subunit ribosomal protein L32
MLELSALLELMRPCQGYLALVDRLCLVAAKSCARSPVHPKGVQRSLQEIPMAVQQNKKSPSKRGMHRAHKALRKPGIAIESTTGEVHLRHHISPTGFYRGRKVMKAKAEA